MHRLERTLTLATSLEEAWDFFSDPRNLPVITPKSLNLTITSDVPDQMYAGMILTYKVHPILGIPLTWVTEITHVVEREMFVDEQRHGPYKMWHHQHFFKEVAAGIEVRDVVDYILPFGPLGKLVHAILVRRQLQDIFDFREEVLRSKFGLGTE